MLLEGSDSSGFKRDIVAPVSVHAVGAPLQKRLSSGGVATITSLLPKSQKAVM